MTPELPIVQTPPLPFLADEIRDLLHRQYVPYSDAALFFDEFPLRPWGGAYADIAILHDDEWSGFEIKSERDSLARLARQQEAYARIFDRCTLLAAPRHVEKAAKLLPDFWWIYSAERGQGFKMTRKGAVSPYVDQAATAELLRRAEANEFLKEAVHPIARRGGRKSLAAGAAALTTLAQLRAAVRAAVRARGNGRGHGV